MKSHILFVTIFQTLRKVREIGLWAVGNLHFPNCTTYKLQSAVEWELRVRSGEERSKQILRQAAKAFTS